MMKISDIKIVLADMLHSNINNYATAGLSSSLLGGADGEMTDKGKVRIFHAERDTREFITPHSHRFDFAAIVLEGEVENIVYKKSQHNGDWWVPSILQPVNDGLGKYKATPVIEGLHEYVEVRTKYEAGDSYSMFAHEIHSISFKQYTTVLFLEGPPIATSSIILEPYVAGKRVPTFKAHDWMFERV